MLTQSYRDATGGGWKAPPQPYNPQHNAFRNWKYNKTRAGASILGTNYSFNLHSVNEKADPYTKTFLGLNMSAIGFGAQVIFDVGGESKGEAEKEDSSSCDDTSNTIENSELLRALNPAIDIGLGKYLGVSIYPFTNQVSINGGIALALPIGVSAQIDTIDH